MTVVQLINEHDRGCGASAQLGYQYSSGDYVLLIDGDMVLHEQFLRCALDCLEENPTVAGVGGFVREMNLINEESRLRVLRHRHMKPGRVDRLNGGGLYRRAAIDSVGYIADRNLHSFEEFELGVRLRARGWKLLQLPESAVDHHGYVVGGYHLMRLRQRTGYARGAGELLRGMIGRGYFWEILRVRALLVSALVAVWLTLLMITPLLLPVTGTRGTVVLLAILASSPVILMSIKYRSWRMGFFCVVNWIANLIATVRGFTLPQVDPCKRLAGRVVCQTAKPPLNMRREEMGTS